MNPASSKGRNRRNGLKTGSRPWRDVPRSRRREAEKTASMGRGKALSEARLAPARRGCQASEATSSSGGCPVVSPSTLLIETPQRTGGRHHPVPHLADEEHRSRRRPGVATPRAESYPPWSRGRTISTPRRAAPEEKASERRARAACRSPGAGAAERERQAGTGAAGGARAPRGSPASIGSRAARASGAPGRLGVDLVVKVLHPL